MKKFMAVMLLGIIITMSTSAFGWFGWARCCEYGCGSEYTYSYYCDDDCGSC